MAGSKVKKTSPKNPKKKSTQKGSSRKKTAQKKVAQKKHSPSKSSSKKSSTTKKREELFRGRLIPALVVLIPLILASVAVLAVHDARLSTRGPVTLQPEETEGGGAKESAEESAEESSDRRPAPEDDAQEAEQAGEADAGEAPDGETGAEGSVPDLPGEETPADTAESRGTLYIVVDDVGYHTQNLKLFLRLPIPITFAVLPKLPDTSVAVELIDGAGAEYILHQPMEPLGKEDPGPGALTTKMNDKEVREVISENLKDLPNAHGINNHMGSKLTADPKLMDEVLALIGEKKLFFLDSRTTADTVAKEYARAHRVAFAERNVFLDNESTEKYIVEALEEGTRIADERGYAVLIGHVWSKELYEVLEEHHNELREQGYSFDLVTNLFREETVHAGSRD